MITGSGHGGPGEFEDPVYAKANGASCFVPVALLFNPVIPIHLTRSTWFWIDIGVGWLFELLELLQDLANWERR